MLELLFGRIKWRPLPRSDARRMAPGRKITYWRLNDFEHVAAVAQVVAAVVRCFVSAVFAERCASRAIRKPANEGGVTDREIRAIFPDNPGLSARPSRKALLWLRLFFRSAIKQKRRHSRSSSSGSFARALFSERRADGEAQMTPLALPPP